MVSVLGVKEILSMIRLFTSCFFIISQNTCRFLCMGFLTQNDSGRAQSVKLTGNKRPARHWSLPGSIKSCLCVISMYYVKSGFHYVYFSSFVSEPL